MREVYWRAQELATKKWVYGDLITTLWDIDNDGNETYQPCYIQERSLTNGNKRYIHFSINPKTVGEYIGKKDRNQRRIYEWDIIRIDICGDIQNYLVSYDNENARFVIGNTGILFWSNFSEKAEVIGNLFDNPNLIDDELIIKEDLKVDCVEIYWGDLTKEKQEEILELLGENGNYDVIPIATIYIPKEEDTDE